VTDGAAAAATAAAAVDGVCVILPMLQAQHMLYQHHSTSIQLSATQQVFPLAESRLFFTMISSTGPQYGTDCCCTVQYMYPRTLYCWTAARYVVACLCAEAEEAAGQEDYTSIIFNLHVWSYRLSQQASSRHQQAKQWQLAAVGSCYRCHVKQHTSHFNIAVLSFVVQSILLCALNNNNTFTAVMVHHSSTMRMLAGVHPL
jgi:hypothetical protein